VQTLGDVVEALAKKAAEQLASQPWLDLPDLP